MYLYRKKNFYLSSNLYFHIISFILIDLSYFEIKNFNCVFTFLKYKRIQLVSPIVVSQDVDICSPSPCGPNSQCKEISGQAVCSCLPTYVGAPPGCRPECVASSECPTQLACKDYKCTNPCPSPCGLNTKCVVVNHSPICSCMPGYSGDPFTTCTPIPRKNNYLEKFTNIKKVKNLSSFTLSYFFYFLFLRFYDMIINYIK